MTTLAEFYSLVSTEIRRGTSLDYQIPAKVQMALTWMERKYTFLYTERFCTLLIDSTVPEPRAIQQPPNFKKMYFWRIINCNGTYSRLTLIDPTDQSANNYAQGEWLRDTNWKTAKPQAYWQDGNKYFWLDNIPDKNYNTELSFNTFTVLPADTTQCPYVIQTYPDIIMYQTMLYMAATMRDADKVGAAYKPLRDEAMEAAVNADIEERQSARSESMQYGWEYKEDVNRLYWRPRLT